MRVNTAVEAVSVIDNDDVIWCQSMAATPYVLLDALAEVAMDRRNLTLLQLHTEKSGALCNS